MGKKAWLFFGNENAGQTAAVLYTLTMSCKRHAIDVQAYLTDVFRRIRTATPAELELLLPDRWIAAHPEARLKQRVLGLGLLTPATVHHGRAEVVLAARQAALTAAHAAHPERFVRQLPRPLTLPPQVSINPPADGPEPRVLQLPHDTNFVPQLSQTS